MRIFSILLILCLWPLSLSAEKKKTSPPSPRPEEPSLPDSDAPRIEPQGNRFPWIKGSASFGSDATFWWLDDSFGGGLIKMQTRRDTPIFYKFNVSIDDLFGLRATANLFLDKILNPLGLFTPDFTLGTAGSSGGAETDIILPWKVWGDEDTGLYPVFHYKYRLFRWENTFISKWLSTNLDYYDETGERHLYGPGTTFATGSQWKDYTLGLGGNLGENFPLDIFIGIEYWDFLAPTLIGMEIHEGYSSGPSLLMQTTNRLIGLRFDMHAGPDGKNPETLKENFALGFGLGMTVGAFSGSNAFFQGPNSLGDTLSAGIHSGFRFSLWEGSEGYILFGAEGTFSLLNTFGSASDPGKILKNLTYDNSGTVGTLAADTLVDVTIGRWETYGGPYLRAGLKF